MTFLTTLRPKLSTDNSTDTPLAGDATYTGTSEDASSYASASIFVYSDVASAENGLSIEFSTDGTNWDDTTAFNVCATVTFAIDVNVTAQFFRLVYTNGSDPQTEFRVSVIFNPYKETSNELTTALTNGVKLDPLIFDAFFRQRVANPETLLDGKFLYDKNFNEWAELIEGGATAVLGSSGAYIDLTVTTSGDRVVRQSRASTPYQPGKSLSILVTGTLAASGTSASYRSRMGYFDDENDKDPSLDTLPTGNGYFFEYDGSGGVSGSGIRLVERSSITGSQVDNVIPQEEWNIDRMDGTGPSCIIADFTTRLIYSIEIEWLGVGSVLCALVIGRQLYPVHMFKHSNGVGTSVTEPYINRPTLPVRYELESLGDAGSMVQICTTVISDGGFAPKGRVYEADRGTSLVGVTTTEVPIISLRLKNSRRRTVINPILTSLMTTSGGNMKYAIYRFISPDESPGPLDATTWVSANSESAGEYNIDATTLDLSGAYPFVKVAGGYYSNNNDFALTDLENRLLVTSNIEGYSDIVVLAVVRVNGGTEQTVGAIQWQEWE